MVAGSLIPLVRALGADPLVVDAMVDAARTAAPELARLPVAETRRHVAVLLDAGLAAFGGATDPDHHDFADATRLGADRAAQGVPLAAVLCGVRAGRTRVFEIAIDRGREAGIPYETLLDGALELDRYASALERHLVEGYHAAERRDRADAAAGLLRRVLLGEEPAPVADELVRFGLNPATPYHCLVSGSPDGAGPERRPRCTGLPGTVLLGTVEGRVAGLSPRPPGAAGAAMLTVFTPAVPLADAADAYRLCVAAWQAAERFGRRGVHAVADLAAETALAAQPGLAGLLRDSLLGRLRPGDPFHRELVSTALSYLDHGQRLDQTASVLHVHPNTVRYRLRRIQELTGLPAGTEEQLTVLETLRWWWALHMWITSLPPRGSPTPARAPR